MRSTPTWLAKHTRTPHPKKIVWRCHNKDGIYRDSFYWVSLTNIPKKGEYEIAAALDKSKNFVKVFAKEVILAKEKNGKSTRKPLTSSQIVVHLDKEVTVMLNGKQAFKGIVKRSRGNILRNLAKRADINYAFPAEVVVGTKKK
jgi:hypothetical protein